ncbi:hypothetical protein [Anaerospora hongkongensis]|uniref:hypothetical protein n=1 Tax=Anaerospora hongkongensis TaxID=244830 RepID=UPI0028997443|nr:hypothetical protein [Anaerospora hongkongensis]
MVRKNWILIIAMFFCISGLAIGNASAGNPQIVKYGDTVKLYFDEREWKLGADNDKTNIFYEYVTDGQTVNNWKELVTLQMYKGMQNKVSAEQFAQGYLSMLYNACGDKLKISIIRKDSSDYLFEWKVNGHPKVDDQYEIDRIIVGKESIVFIHYVIKTSMVTPDNRMKWIQIINKSTLE